MTERPTPRILVVDDDEDLRGVMVLILRGAGYDVDHAGNGFEALRELDQRGYDLVVSDLDMPGLDGPGLYMEMSRRCKPFKLDDLCQLVARLLDGA